MNENSERAFLCAVWLVRTLNEDHALLRVFMGGGPHRGVQDAMADLEKAGRVDGFSRSDLDEALDRIAQR
jgi:hypothetical protein